MLLLAQDDSLLLIWWIPNRKDYAQDPSKTDPNTILPFCFKSHFHQHHVTYLPTAVCVGWAPKPWFLYFCTSVCLKRLSKTICLILVHSDFFFMSQSLYHYFQGNIFSYFPAPLSINTSLLPSLPSRNIVYTSFMVYASWVSLQCWYFCFSHFHVNLWRHWLCLG